MNCLECVKKRILVDFFDTPTTNQYFPWLASLSGKYPWERYEPPYPPSYGLNSTTIVLLGEWLWH